MAKGVVRQSDILESGYNEAVQWVVRGIGVLIASGFILYVGRKALELQAALTWLYWLCTIVGVLGVLGGLGLIGLGIWRGVKARKIPTVAFPCPYCDKENHFLEPPTEDFACEGCDRQVHFLNGAPVPVRTIVCQACRAEHKVAVTVERYVCDRCNRPLRIVSDVTQKIAAGIDMENSEDALQNYDVLLVAYDSRRENDVAFKVQNLLVINMREARRLMHTATSAAPLIVAQNLPERKAEAIRRQLQEIGATASLRPTTVGARTAAR